MTGNIVVTGIALAAAAILVAVLPPLDGAPARAEEAEHHTEGQVEHHQKLNLGVGFTRKEGGDSGFTLAASYDYRFSSPASIGLLGERAFGDVDTWVVGAPVKLYPGGHWVVITMPAVEIHDSETEPMFRLGAGYEFEMEGYAIAPEVNANFVDGEVNLVAGIVFGFGF